VLAQHFPSNIQGCDWYEVRVSGEGWLGAAANLRPDDRDETRRPGTRTSIRSSQAAICLRFHQAADFAEIAPRRDLLGVPLTQLSNTLEGTIPRERQL